MLKYGSMTHKQACEAMAAHDMHMRASWIVSCLSYMQKWEKVRSPERWKNMGEYQRKKVIKGWIYRRDILTGKYRYDRLLS